MGFQKTFNTLKQLEKELAPHLDEASVSAEIKLNEKVKVEIFAALAKIDSLISSDTTAGPTSHSNYYDKITETYTKEHSRESCWLECILGCP